MTDDSTDYKTIRVPKDAFQTAKQRKDDAGQTWAEYVTDDERGSPDAEDVATELTARINVDTEDAQEDIEDLKELVEALRDDLDDVNAELPDALSYEDVVSASEAGARAALDDYQR